MVKPNSHPYAIHKIKLSNGSRVAYLDEGQGPTTLLFIHGLATYSFSWKKNIDNLKNNYRCVAIDLPGNGYSDKGNFPYGIHFFAGAVYDFIQLTGLTNVCLVGHSMGAQVALNLLINQRDAACKLILCAPAGFEKFSSFEINMYYNSMHLFDLFSSDEESLRTSIRNSFYQSQEQGDDMINELIGIMHTYPARAYKNMITACIQSMLKEPVINDLHVIRQPTLVVYGERDALIPNRLIHLITTRQVADEGIKRMPNAQLKMIPQSGHFVQWEKADVVNELIRNFAG